MTSSSPKILWIISVINFLGLIAFGSFYLLKQPSIVYVDSVKLINGYKGTETARASINQKTTLVRSNLDTLDTEIRLDIMKLDEQAGKLTAKEKKAREDVIRAKQQRLDEYQRTVQMQLQQQE